MHLPPELLRKRRTLELGGSELRLEVNQPTLNFDVQDLVASLQDEIGGTSISIGDRVFHSHPPRSV
jgi:hypothetical protein